MIQKLNPLEAVYNPALNNSVPQRSKTCPVLVCMRLTLAMSAIRINASMTAYSIDVGPSSFFRNRMRRCMGGIAKGPRFIRLATTNLSQRTASVQSCFCRWQRSSTASAYYEDLWSSGNTPGWSRTGRVEWTPQLARGPTSPQNPRLMPQVGHDDDILEARSGLAEQGSNRIGLFGSKFDQNATARSDEDGSLAGDLAD